MLWLEMSRDPVHGGGDWGFGKSLWSPSRKTDGSHWAFWETVLKVQEGDSVLHLRGKSDKAFFVGFSKALNSGYETTERPPITGQWSYANSFYRVDLVDFQLLSESIKLTDIFSSQEQELRNYFSKNIERTGSQKRRLFYVIQSNRLQCLNGAYLSEVDDGLANILLAVPFQYHIESKIFHASKEVSTGEQLRALKARLGQDRFSEQVRNNYSHSCCFPGCQVTDDRFLVAGHIARWSDNEELRGQISNGICFCLMHDKAFEKGLFTLTTNYEVWVNYSLAHQSSWATYNLIPFHGKQICLGTIFPDHEAIREHWKRHKITVN